MKYRVLRVSVHDWQLIEGTLDNSVAVDVVNGDVSSAIDGSVVRDAGWRASAHSAGPHSDIGWPPDDEVLEVDLSERHWHYIIEQLERWNAVNKDGPNEHLADMVQAQLDRPA